jgi:phage head maturation protease
MLQRERYAANAELKYKKTETGVGELTGYASVFGVEDSAGDVIDPTAFDKTLSSCGETVMTGPGCPVARSTN